MLGPVRQEPPSRRVFWGTKELLLGTKALGPGTLSLGPWDCGTLLWDSYLVPKTTRSLGPWATKSWSLSHRSVGTGIRRRGQRGEAARREIVLACTPQSHHSRYYRSPTVQVPSNAAECKHEAFLVWTSEDTPKANQFSICQSKHIMFS